MVRIGHFVGLVGMGAIGALCACTVGPNYSRPATAAPQAEARGAFLRAGGDAVSTAPDAQWWTVLGDPVLDDVIQQALAKSPDLAVAEARIRQARASLAVHRSSRLPTIGTTFVAPYVSLPPGSLDIKENERLEGTSFSLGFDASWELDLFGGNRRRAESAEARAMAAEAGAADARVSLSSEVARLYIALRLQQAVTAVQEQQVAIDRDLTAFAQQRLTAGTAGAQPLDQARGQLVQMQAALATSQAETTVLIDQMAVLTGQEPGALDALLAQPAAVPLPPAAVSIGDPATLLRNRPDIRMAERQLAAATADIGAKVADRFPKIGFYGLLGLGGPDISGIVDPSNLLSVALPQLRWSLFDSGRGANGVRGAEAMRDEVDAKYRRTILSALQDAENALTRFGAQRIAYAKAVDARDRIAHMADLQGQRVAAGTASRGDELLARRSALQTELATAQTAANLTAGFIAIEKALGLGWEKPGKAP